MNYFETQIPEMGQINGNMQIESADSYGKDLTDPEDQFTVSDVLLSETQ